MHLLLFLHGKIPHQKWRLTSNLQMHRTQHRTRSNNAYLITNHWATKRIAEHTLCTRWTRKRGSKYTHPPPCRGSTWQIRESNRTFKNSPEIWFMCWRQRVSPLQGRGTDSIFKPPCEGCRFLNKKNYIVFFSASFLKLNSNWFCMN